MVMVTTVVMMTRLRKRGGREQKHQRQNDQLLHAAIVARMAALFC
jgi:hypothetical protein